MHELLQFAPFIQSGILIAGLIVIIIFTRMLYGFAKMMMQAHTEAMAEMRVTSSTILAVAKALEGLSVRVDTLHEDVREVQRFLRLKDTSQ